MTQADITTSKTPPPHEDDPGLALMKRPFTMTKEQEQELIEKCRAQLKILLENEQQDKEWCSRVTYHGVKVSQKKEGAFCIARGTTLVPEGLTLEDVHDQYSNDFRNNEVMYSALKRVDPMNTSSTIVTEIQHQELLDKNQHESLKILWANFYVAPLISDRDFVFAQHEVLTKCPITGDDIFVSNEVNVELLDVVPDMEKTLGRVRATLRCTGYVFRPSKDHPGRLQMSFLGQADPKGYLPVSVVNLASISQALNAGRLRDTYEYYSTVKSAMGGGVSFPFDCSTLSRRGGTFVHKIPLVVPEDTAASCDRKSFFVRLQAHSERNVSVELEMPDPMYLLSAGDKDEMGETLVGGKQVTFGGANCLDCVLQVSLGDSHKDNNENGVLFMKFTNTGWKKSNVTVPVKMTITATDPTTDSSNAGTASTLTVEQ